MSLPADFPGIKPFAELDEEARAKVVEAVIRDLNRILPADAGFFLMVLSDKGDLLTGADIPPGRLPGLLRNIAAKYEAADFKVDFQVEVEPVAPENQDPE